MRLRPIHVVCMILVAAALAACADATPPSEVTIANVDDPSTWSDGGPTSSPVTEVDCSHAGLILHDLPYQMGQSLCLDGQGTVSLESYHRLVCDAGVCTTPSWAGSVKSYASKEQYGYFHYYLEPAHQQVGLRPFLRQQRDDLSPYEVQGSHAVTLYGACVPRRCPLARTCGLVDDGCGGQLCCTNGCPGRTCLPDDTL